MNIELYLAFVFATAALILIPGPVVAVIIANSLAHGGRRALVTMTGASAAVVVHLTLVVLGMASFMLALAAWFEWLRWLGMAYLVYLGLRAWCSKPALSGENTVSATPRGRLFWQGFIVSVTNPKTLFFYAAFFPQFIDTARPIELQMTVLCLTFLVIQITVDGAYALLGGRLGGFFASHRRARFRNRLTGSLLIGAGLGLALARRGN
jgi:threonine/homoserine/homoserine lactone efflux protein